MKRIFKWRDIMKYLKMLLASTAIICSGIMDNVAYCYNNVQLINDVIVKINDIFSNNSIGAITENIISICTNIKTDIALMKQHFVNIPSLNNIQLNTNELNNMLPILNINNTNNLITCDLFINYVENSINTLINGTVQQINNHIGQYKDNHNTLKPSITQELRELYYNITNITNSLNYLLLTTLNKNELDSLTASDNMKNLQNNIRELDSIILLLNTDF